MPFFGKVASNKLKLFMYEMKRKIFWFLKKLNFKYYQTDNYWIKAWLVLTPFVNLFIFWWLFNFIFVIIVDIFYFWYVASEE